MRANILKFVVRNKKSALILLLIFFGLAIPIISYASLGKSIVNALFNGIGNLVLQLMSMLFALLVGVFLAVVKYDFSTFMGADKTVDIVWRLLRDLSNMFFIIIMIAIAFGTMLKLESYRWQRMMPKLIGMAVLINFSKTIALIILDFGQVLMMTFVNAFKDIAVDNLTSGLMITRIYSTGESSISGLGATFAAQSLMAIMMIVATLVILTIAILLIFRMVVIWFLVAVSPVAYLTAILDTTKKYSQQWWRIFIKNVFLGATLTFFLWFVFLFLGSGLLSDSSLQDSIGEAGVSNEQFGASEALSINNLTNFILGIVMLIVGTGMAVKAADFGGGAAGSVWEGGKGWFDRWLGKGGHFKDIPGAKLLSKAPGIKHIGNGISNIRARIGPAQGEKAGFLRTLASKGRSGISAGEFSWADKGFGRFVSRFSALHPLEAAVVMSSKGGRAQMKRAKEERDRIEAARAAQRVSVPSYYAAHLGEAGEAAWAFTRDKDGRRTKLLRTKANLETKLSDIDSLSLEGKNYYDSLVSNIDNQIDETILNKLKQEGTITKESTAEEKAFYLNTVKEDPTQHDNYGITNLIKEKEEREQEKKDIDRHLDGAYTDEEKEEVFRNLQIKKLNRQLTNVRSQQGILIGNDANGAYFDSSGMEDRLDTLNKLTTKELKLLQKLRDTKETGEKDKIFDELKKNHKQLNKYATTNQSAMLSSLPNSVSGLNPDNAVQSLQGFRARVNSDYTRAKSNLAEQDRIKRILENYEEHGSDTGSLSSEKNKLTEQIEELDSVLLNSAIKAEYYRKVHETNLINEEKKQIRTLDYPTLISYYQVAKNDNNINLAKAVLEKLAEDNNINEIVKAEGFEESPEGLRQFGRKFMQNFALTKQEAFGFMKDIADMAEAMGNWAYAYTYVFEDGQYRETDEEEQAELALPMMEKRGVNDVINSTRWAIGWTDKSGNARIVPHALAWIEAHTQDLAWPMNRNYARPEFMRHLLGLFKGPLGSELRDLFANTNTEDVSHNPDEKNLLALIENRTKQGIKNNAELDQRAQEAVEKLLSAYR